MYRTKMLFKTGPAHRYHVLVTLLFCAALISQNHPVYANKILKAWKDMRLEGLVEFSKGHYDVALKQFERNLAFAQNHKLGGRDEAMSTYDIAQVYQYMGHHNKESELYYRRALTLAKRSYSDQSPETVLFLQDLITLLKSEHRAADAARLDREVDKIIAAHPDSNSIGTASIESDGSIQMFLEARGPDSLGHSFMKYHKTDYGYRNELLHLGPMKIGEQKYVLPYRDEPVDPDEPPPPPIPPPPPPHDD